jgi:hypothetical protein
MAIEGTQVEFDLPSGYEIDGTVHKHVTMRKVKNSDIIAIQKDQGLKAMAHEGLELSIRNPVTAMRVNAQLAEMFSILFTRVVLQLGDIEKPGKVVFLDLYQGDMQVLMEHYATLNGVDIEEAKQAILDSPLA